MLITFVMNFHKVGHVTFQFFLGIILNYKTHVIAAFSFLTILFIMLSLSLC